MILHATRAELAERGYEGASIRSIARRAVVDPRLVRYYFPTKMALVLAAVAKLDLADGLASGTLADAVGRLWREQPTDWEAFVACGMSAEPGVRDVFAEAVRALLTGYDDGDETARVQLLLAFGHLIGGWLVTGGRTDGDAPGDGGSLHERVLAEVGRRVAEIAQLVA